MGCYLHKGFSLQPWRGGGGLKAKYFSSLIIDMQWVQLKRFAYLFPQIWSKDSTNFLHCRGLLTVTVRRIRIFSGKLHNHVQCSLKHPQQLPNESQKHFDFHSSTAASSPSLVMAYFLDWRNCGIQWKSVRYKFLQLTFISSFSWKFPNNLWTIKIYGKIGLDTHTRHLMPFNVSGFFLNLSVTKLPGRV